MAKSDGVKIEIRKGVFGQYYARLLIDGEPFMFFNFGCSAEKLEELEKLCFRVKNETITVVKEEETT